MAAQTEISFDDARIRDYLDGLSKRFDQINKRDKAVVGIISAIVYRDIVQHFEREEGPDGPWQAWSPRYAKFMASIGRGGNRLLQDTGRLRQAFQPTNVRASVDGLVWFNNAQTKNGFPYAAAHDEGGQRLPRRKFMWLSGEGMAEMETQILKFLEG